MAIIGRPRIETLRNVLLLVFLVLVVTIIFTPLLVNRGFSIFPEESLESVLLFIQVSLAWNIFRRYERTVRSLEKEISKLEKEYQKREKELIETFAYLGKMNVQMSLIKSFLQKLKAPANRKEMKEYINEVLHMALSISKKEWITLRIIEPQKYQTISEYWATASPKTKVDEVKIGNKEIVELTKDKGRCNEDGYCVVSSLDSKLTSHKTFLVFWEEGEIDQEILGFLKAAVNQCEVIYTLFAMRNGNGKH